MLHRPYCASEPVLCCIMLCKIFRYALRYKLVLHCNRKAAIFFFSSLGKHISENASTNPGTIIQYELQTVCINICNNNSVVRKSRTIQAFSLSFLPTHYEWGCRARRLPLGSCFLTITQSHKQSHWLYFSFDDNIIYEWSNCGSKLTGCCGY